MGFSFYMTFDSDIGLSLYEIRYKGNGILYELGSQAVLVHYAGPSCLPSPCSPSQPFTDVGKATILTSPPTSRAILFPASDFQ